MARFTGERSRPGLNEWYKGARFATNSAGQRDHEYSRVPPGNTFRIAVLGSSWEMGSGVAEREIWHAQLEEVLNSDDSGIEYEIINFGVDQYGIGEIIATLDHKVAAWQPDLVVIALTYYTPTVLWEDPPPAYQVQPRRNPFFDLHSLRVIDHRFRLGLFRPDDSVRLRAPDAETVARQMQKAASHMQAFHSAHGTPIAVLKLAYQASWAQSRDEQGPLHGLEPAIVYRDLTDRLQDSGYSPAQLRVSVWDSHPNNLGHRLLMGVVREALTETGLLPTAGAD